MASKTAIVCLHEGTRGHSIDPVFINKLIRTLKPSWIRWQGSNIVRLDPCGGRKDLIGAFAQKLRDVVPGAGGETTLMVWADVDDDMPDCDALKNECWSEAEQQGVTRGQFDQVVFVFAKDRIENWIEFLRTGATDESKEGPRIKHGTEAAEAARILAAQCQSGAPIKNIPPSLEWSCKNWRDLKSRMNS